LSQKEPFLFKSYERIIGIAHDVNELKNELERLSKIDPNAVNYHIKERHIAMWLYYIGENDLAKKFENVKDINQALSLLNEEKRSVHEQTPPKENTTIEQSKPESQQKPKRRGGKKKKLQ
jgi:hypothetical protein